MHAVVNTYTGLRTLVDIEHSAPRVRAREFTKRKLLQLGIASALATGMLAAASDAQARITKIQILTRTTAFGGYSFPGVGQYEVITGIATGVVNPSSPQNAVITDINLAPTTNGNVVYQHNFYILKPLNLRQGNHKMMYEPPNRGGKTYQTLNNTPTDSTTCPPANSCVNDPAAITDPTVLANSFLWPQGYTTVWSGWENNLGPLNGLTATAILPVAYQDKISQTITGPAYEYIVTSGTTSLFTLTYPAASSSQANATLTHRVHLDGVPQVVPWAYTDATNTAIKLVPGPNFVNNDIYEFSYIAKNPTVNGLGLAAIRDFNSFLRYATVDDFGTANPLAGDIRRIYTETSSQPARTLNDFTHLGFNQDENSRKVFDGMMQWIGAGDGLNMNYRWSQTKRTERNRQEQLYLEGLFPFANQTLIDPISRTIDGRYKKCSESHTCPLAMEFYSANEYWVKAASLMTTDPMGKVDLPDHPDARLYLLSSKQHGGAGNPTSKGVCQQFLNPLDSAPVQRALWEDLDQWSTKRVEPPPSQIPKLHDGTLVPPLPQAGMGFPNIPGVTYTGLKTTRYRFNYGPDFYQTFIPTINPPVITPPYEDNPANGPIYPSFVPKTDSDGNDIAGIRLPELTVPLATYTGWALRSGVWANDGCESSGQYIPFKATAAERIAAGDPRPSVQERYSSFAMYRSAVARAINHLVRNRFMLCEETASIYARLLQAGLDAGVPAPQGNQSPQEQVPACLGKGGHDEGHDE